MLLLARRTFTVVLAAAALVGASVVGGAEPGWGAEVGQPAPDFKLSSTTGVDVSLSDFRDKTWVLLEFYGHDFVPT